MPRFAIVAVLSLLAACSFSEEPEPKPAVESCELRLQNGSVLKGTLKSPRAVTLKVKGGTKTISFDDVWSLTIGVVKKEEADRVVTSDGVVEGWTTDSPEYVIDTGYGVLKIPAADLNAALEKQDRKQAMDDFRSARVRVLITSDVAARGLDIKGVTHIFNLDVPTQSKAYLHRVGRTARAGAKGMAITLVTADEVRLIRRYESELGIVVRHVDIREGRLIVAYDRE